ncbi:uncharacterized protein B0I36DRAFT_353428 [Microdochium trichocladiopsis]|uniref:Uncharacterized protein n=1 Tax=Microdochium trichocladiopsis TaxID=1682393 RepID=A0A9P8XXV1_9PEZI|nr:uncharacterized protein B0I36DRAFT_353428 [Microdochium trichocladiopsis]KAH7025289.1 hypothetical protein B0I36DRAFT_353428 [Microdochium trichocladiopsis]
MLISSFSWLAALITAAVFTRRTAASPAFVLTVALFPDHPAVQLNDGRILFNATGQNAIFNVDRRFGITNSASAPCRALRASKIRQEFILHSADANRFLSQMTTECSAVNRSHQWTASSVEGSQNVRGSAKRQGLQDEELRSAIQTYTLTKNVTQIVHVAEKGRGESLSHNPSTPLHAPQLLSRQVMNEISPRGMVEEWKAVETARTNWVKQDEVKRFVLEHGQDQTFATSEYFGCSVFVLVTSKSIVVGHLSECKGATGPALEDPFLTEQDVIQTIEDRMSTAVYEDIENDPCKQVYLVITGHAANQFGTGVKTLTDWFIDFLEVPKENIRYIGYGHDYPLFLGNPDVDDDRVVRGLSLFHWQSLGRDVGSSWTIYLGNVRPRLQLWFDRDGRLDTSQDVVWGMSKSGMSEPIRP